MKNQDILSGKQLKIIEQNYITSFLHYSLKLCIILSEQRNYPWFYQNFIQLRSSYEWIGYHPVIDFMDKLDTERIYYDGFDVDDIISFIKLNIDDDRYVIAFVDEYHIPDRGVYKTSHFLHQILVYGYDENSGVFLTLGFNKNRTFTNSNISYEDFQQSFLSGKSDHLEMLPYEQNPCIELLSFKDDASEEASCVNNFINKLHSYIYPDELYLSSPKDNKLDLRYGMDVYDGVVYGLESCQIDCRFIYLFYENKRHLFDCFNYFLENNIFGSKEIEHAIHQYAGIVDQANMIKNLFFKAIVFEDSNRISADNPLKKELLKLVHAMRTEESQLIQEIYKLITNL